MEIIIVLAMLLVLCTIALGIYGSRRGIARARAKALAGANIGLFFGLLAVTTVFLFSGFDAGAAEAAEGVAAAAADNSKNGLAFLSAAISTGLATVGAGIAVAITGSAALGAISEDQSLLGKSLIFVGLAEGIAIYGLIVSILILGYVG